MRDGECAAGTEVVLQVDEQQGAHAASLRAHLRAVYVAKRYSADAARFGRKPREAAAAGGDQPALCARVNPDVEEQPVAVGRPRRIVRGDTVAGLGTRRVELGLRA